MHDHLMSYLDEHDNRALWRRMSAEVMALPDDASLSDRPELLARHEAGHAAAMVALGGTLIRIAFGDPDGVTGCAAHTTGTVKVGDAPDDFEWGAAVVKWAAPLAAGTLAGASGDLTAIRDLGRPYLVDRDASSAFAGARFIVERDQALIDALAAAFLARGDLNADELSAIVAEQRDAPARTGRGISS